MVVAAIQERDAAAAGEALQGLGPAEQDAVRRAIDYVTPLYAGRSLATTEPTLPHAIATASVLAMLRLDAPTRIAGLLSGVPELDAKYKDALQERFGAEVAGIVANVARLDQLRLVTRGVARQATSTERSNQVEVLRKMLLAMVEDLRAVLVRLASRTQTCAYLPHTPAPLRREIAQETLDIYAPLANRLGVWQLKWRLEDAALQVLEPAAFARITAQLDEGRDAREHFIAQCVERLRAELAAAHVRGEISGRPKHLFSIWNKMQRKGREFADLTDLRGVRVIVEDVRDCYTVLGVVHNLWQPIPREFDDYISRPKANGYRSLHTAVVAPDGRPLEVQIRTHAMHRHAELGVAAHWRYKEGAGPEPASRALDYESKIAWLRQVLAWRDEIVDGADWVDHTKHAALDDTVYVLTPQGRVIDLPRGATPIDMAYAIHSDLGHRCRGAKVDGHMVPLDTVLDNGQTVEIVVAKQGGPSRDWLNPERGYLGSHRAKAKVRQWFNAEEQQALRARGRAELERTLQREGKTSIKLESLAADLGLDSADALFAAIGRDEIGPRQLQLALRGEDAVDERAAEVVVPRPRAAKPASGILVVGVDRLLTQLAKCCRPVPPDPIRGFVTRGRGVSIHRAACANLAQMLVRAPERGIEAQWGAKVEGVFAADLLVRAQDRQGLLRDVSDALTRNRVNVIAVSSQSRRAEALMQFTVEVAALATLERALDEIREVRGVFAAHRR